MIIDAPDVIIFRKGQGVDVNQRAPGIRVNAGNFVLSLDQVKNGKLIFADAYVVRDFQYVFRVGHRVLPGQDQFGAKSFFEC